MKIEIRELRKGNIFQYRNNVKVNGKNHTQAFVFDRLYDNDAIIATQYKGTAGLFAGSENGHESLFPIPFTTEWAERFNLIGSVINGFCIAPSEHKGHDYDLCLYDEHTWDSERTILCPINSVHHCQNLFLDLANHILE